MQAELTKTNQASFIRMFAGIPVHNFDEKEALDFILARLHGLQKTLLMYANSNFVVSCQPFVAQLNSEEVKIYNDGVSIDAASKLLYGEPFKANLNGTDFTPKLLASLTAQSKVVLIGAKPGVAKRTGEFIARTMSCQVLATFDGYDDMRDTAALITRVNALKPDVVLVALGNPRQERWMLEYGQQLEAPLIVGVGALFDFLSKTVKRAPMWVRRLKLEWFYRLCLEPKRLLKRYTIDVIMFFYICLKLK